MTDLDPMSQHDVERELHRLCQELSKVTISTGDAAMAAARTDVAYKKARAHAWIHEIGHKGTVPEKEAMIEQACIAEYEAMRLAEATYKSLRDKATNLRTQIEALRTVAANVRSVIQGGF